MMDRKYRREPSCVLCGVQFYFKEPTHPVGAKCPLLLHCGHSVCEGCMRSVTRGSTSVKCTICSTVSEANKFKSPEELRAEFPLNVYAVGQVSLKRFSKSKSGDSLIGFYFQKKQMETNAVVCCECEVTPADCSCRQCSVQLCNGCFIKVHSAGIILRKHEKMPLIETEKTFTCKEALCKEHLGEVFKFYCNVCLEYCCKDCVYKKHLEHSCVEVIQKNEEILQEFSEAYDEANSVLKHLYSTRKKLQHSGTQLQDEDALNVEKQVTTHFSHIHGLLQLQEAEFLKKIKNAQDGTHSSLVKIASELEQNIKEMEAILTESKASMEPNNLNNRPLFQLLEKLKNVAAMPCHLILNNDEDSSKLLFSVDANVFEALKKHCTINVPTSRSYELRSKFNLPDDFEVENISDFPDPFKRPDLIYLNNCKTKKQEGVSPTELSLPKLPQTEVKTKGSSYQNVVRKNKVTQQKGSGDDSCSTTSTDSALENIFNVPPLAEGTTEIVKMCHLISPNSFYVQRKCCQNQIEKLRDYFSRQANIRRIQPENIEIGQMYLVPFTADNKWYRAVVKKILNNMCEIFYVDYGNSERVLTTKLREIPDIYIKIPEQAIHCSLFGCAPKEKAWNEEAFNFIASMSNGVELSMHVERISKSSGLHEVYLRSVDDKNGSFTDALIFLDCAVKTDSTSVEGGLYKQPCPTNKKSFFKDVGIKKNETFDAHITHINTPTNFYVQRITDGGHMMLQIMDDLTRTYSRFGPNDQLIYTPTVGMPVAAKFSDGKWYRGVILRIPRPRFVDVQYIDFGNVQTLNWMDIRVLQPRFLRMAAQGLKCVLSDVAPKHPKGWSTSAKKAFENMAKKKLILRVYVEEVMENHLSIVLYETQLSKDICINGLLVKEGHAISVGRSSAKSRYYRQIDNRSDDTESVSSNLSVAKPLPQKVEEVAIPYVEKEFVPPKRLDSVLSVSSTVTSSNTSLTIDDSEHEEDAARIKVKVLKLVSPSEFYISFDSTLKQMKKLTEDMTKFYNSSEEVREWNDGDKCAVLSETDNKWYRGLVSEVSGSNCKVFLKDISEVVEVDDSRLRSLDPQFTSVMDGSFKCHMSALLPSGGSRNWPGSAIDYLNGVINENLHLYIKKLGGLVNDSLPVQLWVKNVKIGGALDPVTEEWIDVGKTLIALGFALPDRKSEHYLEVRSEDEPAAPIKCSDFEIQRIKCLNLVEESFQLNGPSLFRPIKPNVYKRSLNTIPKHISRGHLNSIKDWSPAEPFKKLDFIAIPTYVDNECAIYIQDKEQSEATLELIQKALLTLFEGTVPKPHDLMWSKGQICIAFYEPDGKWYRGKVLNVTNDHIEVLFVDYGNVEFLQPEELRKQITMGHIPLQCHRCLTEGLIPISPDGKWPVKALDFIHGTIVTKECRVCLKPPSTEGGEYVILSLNVPGGLELIDILMSMHYATYVIDCDEIGKMSNDEDEIISESDLVAVNIHKTSNLNLDTLNGEEPIQLSNVRHTPQTSGMQNPYIFDWFEMAQFPQEVAKPELKFHDFLLPDSLVELLVEVTVVCTGDSCKVNIFNCDDPQVMATISEFRLLQTLIQAEAPDLPLINEPVKDLPCVGCFTLDDVWYRGIIKEVIVSEKLVNVQYVDYGNEEKIPLERLREIKEEWTKTPIQALHVSLFNICRGPFYDATKYQSLFMNCAMSPPYTMTIEARQPGLQVEIYNNNGELIYQPLIDMSVLSRI